MRTRVIVIFPELVDGGLVTDLRREFDPLADLVPPHITLVFPFQSNLSVAELESHVAESVAGIAPFAIHLAGITGHEGEYLFLNVKRGNDTLIALHDRLYQGSLRPFLSHEHTYIPHMTIGRLPDQASWRAAIAATKGLEVSHDTMAREVSVYAIESGRQRHVESRIPLTRSD
jgi:2'-5' RNA ligase